MKDEQLIIRSMVRLTYDVQKIRIMAGNRIVANFKKRIVDMAISELPETATDEERAKHEEKVSDHVLELIRKDYERIADGVAKLPSLKKFQPTDYLLNYAELVLVDQYVRLLKQEENGFYNLQKVLDSYPLYTQFLQHIDGMGPQMAGVMISEIDISKSKYSSSLWAYCFPEKTMVSTPNGMIPIERIKQRQWVYDHVGNTRRVRALLQKKYSGKMLTIKMSGTLSIKLTEDHPICVHKNPQATGEWVAAKNVRPGDYLSIPKIKYVNSADLTHEDNIIVRDVKEDGTVVNRLTPSVCRFLGRYAATGYAATENDSDSNHHRLCIVFDKRKASHMDNFDDYEATAAELPGGCSVEETDESITLRFGDGPFVNEMLYHFGGKVEHRKLPSFIMGLPVDNILSQAGTCTDFMQGCVQGLKVDNPDDNGLRVKLSIFNRGLAFQLQALLVKTNLTSSLYFEQPEHKNGNSFCIKIPGIVGSFGEDEHGGELIKVKSIESEQVFNVPVYNLNVVDPNTYQVQNVAVHNCGLDTVEIGYYIDDAGKERRLQSWEVDEWRSENSPDTPWLINGHEVQFRVEGRSRKEGALVKRKYVTSDGKESERNSITFNPWLKTKLLGVLAGSIIKRSQTTVDGVPMGSALRLKKARELGFKSTTSDIPMTRQVDAFLIGRGHDVVFKPTKYGKIYYDYKARLDNHPKHQGKTPNHRHFMALRYMVKMLLIDYYRAGRTLEGLPVYDPYAMAKLGLHHGEDPAGAEEELY